MPLSSDLETKDPSMYKRLQYAKEILIQMINKQDGQEGDKNEERQNMEKMAETHRV